MDKILIVIPVINLWDQYSIHCMESIAAQKCDVPFEVLIINNNSTDETVNKAEDFGNRKMPGRVHVITNDHNKGVAASWNQGTKWGMDNGFTHFIIANNDILLSPFAVQKLYERFKKGGVVLVSCVDVIGELPVPQAVLDPENAVNKKEDSEAPHPNFSCFMISTETVDKIGWFDEVFEPAYFEDNDYHYRCKLGAGEHGAIATTTSVFIHYGSRTQNQALGTPIVPGDKFQKNHGRFLQKWGGETGHEAWKHPYNNEAYDHTKVWQQ